MYLLQLMDNYAASFSALIIGFFEVMAISWVYGKGNINNFNFQFYMLGKFV